MTSFDKLLAGAKTEAAVVPGKPEKSYLLEQITPDADGEVEMPKKGKPHATAEIERIRKWIAEGAVDDTPENARQRYDSEHPPAYSRPPVITSLDYSPDGTLLAISGFHEVILQKVDTTGAATPLARLVGLSDRIESIRFSPDGAKIAAAGQDGLAGVVPRETPARSQGRHRRPRGGNRQGPLGSSRRHEGLERPQGGNRK